MSRCKSRSSASEWEEAKVVLARETLSSTTAEFCCLHFCLLAANNLVNWAQLLLKLNSIVSTPFSGWEFLMRVAEWSNDDSVECAARRLKSLAFIPNMIHFSGTTMSALVTRVSSFPFTYSIKRGKLSVFLFRLLEMIQIPNLRCSRSTQKAPDWTL